MKKALKFLIPVLGNTAMIFADGNGDCPKDCPAPKKECKTVCKEKCEPCPTKKICKTTCVTVRPRPPCECVSRAYDCGVDFFVTADFTYWKAKEDGLEFASTEPSAASAAPAQGRVYHTHANYKPGFKVGAGMDFGEWGWDFYANYTWFRTNANHSHSTTSAASSTGLALNDSFWFANAPGNGTTNATYTAASSSWNLRMNVLDACLGRKIYFGKHLMVRPSAGFKGVWNKQNLNNSYSSATASVTTANQLKNNGVGVRAGVDTSFHFTRGFSFFGNMALTALWQRFRTTRQDTNVLAATSAVNIRDRYTTVTPILEMMVGLTWETWWSGDNYHFAVRAGWEEQVWFDQNRFIRLPGAARMGNSDLSLQGLTLGVMFEF